MDHCPLGNTGINLSPIGFGAFKIGRNEKIKYAHGYDLPTDDEVVVLLNGVLNLGINYIDTAPAYGLSEQRIGQTIMHRKSEFTLSTKVGETFADGQSTYDFSAAAVQASIDRSRDRLRSDTLDLVFVHSDGNDMAILEQTDVVKTLQSLRDAGTINHIGFSGKTIDGAQASLAWADAIMVEYHLNDRSHEAVMQQAAETGVGVIVKKGLAAGNLNAAEAIKFVLSNPAVSSLVIGGLNLEHIGKNVQTAMQA